MDDARSAPAPGGHSSGHRLRVALVGAGLVGQAAHAITLAEETDRFEFVAVVDPSATVSRAVADRYRVQHAVATLAEALPLGLDAVVVAVPDPAHRDVCVEALTAGLHVFCEKPLATSLEEVDEIIAARGDRVLQCGYMKLYDPAVERLVQLLSQPSAELVYLSIEVNDPDQAPFVDHLGLHSARDVPAELIESTRRRGAQAVDETLGRPATDPERRAFEAYLGALVHDVSLAHHLLAPLGFGPPLRLVDAGYFDLGAGVSLTWTLPPVARAQLTHLNLPGVPDYRERVTVYLRDRILELTFPSPYLRHLPTRLTERRCATTAPGVGPGVTGQPLELVTSEYRVSYEEAFRSELRAFHASITTGAPVRSTAEAARADLSALLDALRMAGGVLPSPH